MARQADLLNGPFGTTMSKLVLVSHITLVLLRPVLSSRASSFLVIVQHSILMFLKIVHITMQVFVLL